MKTSVEQNLEAKTVHVTFTDGCCMDFNITPTGHLLDEDDIGGEMLALHCKDQTHFHPDIRSMSNFKAYEIEAIAELKNDQITSG